MASTDEDPPYYGPPFRRSLVVVNEWPCVRRVLKMFRTEEPDQRWLIDIAETLLYSRIQYKITVVDDHSNNRLISHLY